MINFLTMVADCVLNVLKNEMKEKDFYNMHIYITMFLEKCMAFSFRTL
jgi:hypothetical protein